MIEAPKLCCGCGICESLCPTQAIKMQIDARGFMVPVVDSNQCINCNICNLKCPLQISKTDNTFVPQYYAATSKELSSLKRSASGGAFYVFAKKIIENGGIVFGCILDESLNPIISHTDKVDGLKKMQGSKYVEADQKDSFAEAKSFLESNRIVLYSGAPCRIAALKKYLNKDYDTLICCEIICHGVASRQVFRDYLDYLSKMLGGEIIDISFRDKKKGWGNLLKVTCKKRGKILTRYFSYAESSYYYYYMTNAMYRESCYHCPFANEKRKSDITIGDFWGGRGLIASADPDLGVSAIVASSPIGARLVNECLERFHYVSTDFETMAKENPNLLHPTEYPTEADLFWETYWSGGFDALEELHKRTHRKSILKGIIKRVMPYAGLKIIRKLRRIV